MSSLPLNINGSYLKKSRIIGIVYRNNVCIYVHSGKFERKWYSIRIDRSQKVCKFLVIQLTIKAHNSFRI